MGSTFTIENDVSQDTEAYVDWQLCSVEISSIVAQPFSMVATGGASAGVSLTLTETDEFEEAGFGNDIAFSIVDSLKNHNKEIEAIKNESTLLQKNGKFTKHGSLSLVLTVKLMVKRKSVIKKDKNSNSYKVTLYDCYERNCWTGPTANSDKLYSIQNDFTKDYRVKQLYQYESIE